jgi:hypothetical protein
MLCGLACLAFLKGSAGFYLFIFCFEFFVGDGQRRFFVVQLDGLF